MASESPAARQSNATAPKAPHVLACVFCHQRKIKCDRKSPCANCIKANQPCIPSTRAPPGAGRRRAVKDLLDRLQLCETLLNQVAPRDADGRSSTTTGGTPSASRDAFAAADSPSSPWLGFEEVLKTPSNNPRPTGRIVVEDGRATFVESALRSNVVDHLQFSKLSLGDEVEDFANHSDSAAAAAEDGDGTIPSSRGSMDFDMLALGPLEKLRLWQVFLERVNPLTKVVHVPSLEPLIFEAATDHSRLTPEIEALMCSINVVAILALSESESIQILNFPKSEALRKSTHALKQALARADFLRNHNMTILQCLVLYLVSLQGQFDRHASWILTGTLIRIAQLMGLHRDGERLGLQPFETEMRRRIWWQIILLETKYAILAGFCDTLLPPNWDTKLPSNVNDVALIPGSPEPVRSKDGATEMAFCLLVYESRQFFYENPLSEIESVILGTVDTIAAVPGTNGGSGSGSGSSGNRKRVSSQTMEKYRLIMEQFETRLADVERRYCNATIGGVHVLACNFRVQIVRALRNMLSHIREPPWHEGVHGGGSGGGSGGGPSSQQQTYFRTLVIYFESEAAWYDASDERFRWFFKLHFQSDAFSVMIELLQWQPLGELVDRAWKAIDRVYHHHPELFDVGGKKENLRRAEHLLAGWLRREEAFFNLGMTCEIPPVIQRLRSSGSVLVTSQTTPFAEEWPATVPEMTLFPGFGGGGGGGGGGGVGQTFLGTHDTNPDAAPFLLWDD